MTSQQEQSPHWDERKDWAALPDGTGFYPGYPFAEGLPSDPYAQYEVVPAWGGRCNATLDLIAAICQRRHPLDGRRCQRWRPPNDCH